MPIRHLPTPSQRAIADGRQVHRLSDSAAALEPFGVAQKTMRGVQVVIPRIARIRQESKSFPFRVYIDSDAGAKYICVQSGVHYWWNQNTKTCDAQPLSKVANDHFQAIGAIQAVYVKRVRNPATDAATVTLELASGASEDAAAAAAIAVMNGAPDTKTWVLATVSADGKISHRRISGDIEEYRVS